MASMFYISVSFYLGDAFIGGQFRSKEGERIYTDWHNFCNHELFCHKYFSRLLFKIYVNQKTRNPYSLSLEYSSHLFTWYAWKKYSSMIPGQFDSAALLFFWNTIVLWVISVSLARVRLDGPKWLPSWLYKKPVDGIWEKRKGPHTA